MKNTTLYFVDVDGGEQQTREYASLQTSTISQPTYDKIREKHIHTQTERERENIETSKDRKATAVTAAQQHL